MRGLVMAELKENFLSNGKNESEVAQNVNSTLKLVSSSLGRKLSSKLKFTTR